MRLTLLFILTFWGFQISYSQTCPCPGSSILLSGANPPSGIDQNAANDFCISGTYTGQLPNTAGGSVLTICGTWEPSSNVTVQVNNGFTIYNEGTIDAGANDFVINGNQTLLVNNGTFTSTGLFELADSQLENAGDITAGTVYLHGIAENQATGSIVSTDVCGGTASPSCGLYIGDKFGAFVNDGVMEGEDIFSRVAIAGSGSVTANNTLTLRGDYNATTTDNTFSAPVITLVESNNTLSGTFYTDEFNCENNTFGASVCTLDGSEQQDIDDDGVAGTDCNGNSTNNSDCIIGLVPVKLVSFDLNERNDHLVFTWESAEEVNFSHFELQEGSDIFDFASIEEIDGKGRNSLYQSSSVKRKSGTKYYRLKMIDVDGTEEYSEKILTSTLRSTLDEISIYPNPTTVTDVLTIKNLGENSSLISLYDLNGRRLLHRVSKNTNNLQIDLTEFDINEGAYIIEVINGTAVYTEKLILSK